jgi:hypothetical protein
MDKVSFSLDDAKIKVTERSRGRMKIQIKLSKEEAEGFKNFCNVKPPEMSEEVFYRQIFFAGCNSMTQQIQELYEEHMKSQAENETQNEQTEEQLQDK